jgi:glutathione S-transferase
LFDAKRDRVSKRFDSHWLSRNSALAAHDRKVTIVSSVADKLPWDRLPALSRWFVEMKARPSFQRAAAALDA